MEYVQDDKLGCFTQNNNDADCNAHCINARWTEVRSIGLIVCIYVAWMDFFSITSRIFSNRF